MLEWLKGAWVWFKGTKVAIGIALAIGALIAGALYFIRRLKRERDVAVAQRDGLQHSLERDRKADAAKEVIKVEHEKKAEVIRVELEKKVVESEIREDAIREDARKGTLAGRINERIDARAAGASKKE